MANEKKEIPIIHTTVGRPFDIYLQVMTSTTGYDWYLSTMPAGLVLVETRKEPTITGQVLAPTRVIFTFAADKTGEYKLTFKKLHIWEINTPVEYMDYQVIVREVGLEKHLGSDKFVDVASHMEHFTNPIPIYSYTDPGDDKCGSPKWPDDTVYPLYSYPPIHSLYSFPLGYVKYGFPAQMKYGFPQTKYGFPSELANIVEDKERCVILYGTYWGVAKSKENCIMEYGFPIGIKNDLETLFDSTRFPRGVVEDKTNCVIKYGTPRGIALDMKKCTIKYGFPAVK
ncbi:MAG: protease inhibitor I42 family protein [Acidobacteria bacterium]|jgi:predicted secreted protein|nr:protease inhibitor I42 family protein [Acidobacteriota bacterium]